MSVPISLTLGLSDVGMQSLAIREGDDVMVQQIITNYGEKAINYTGFAKLHGAGAAGAAGDGFGGWEDDGQAISVYERAGGSGDVESGGEAD